MSDIYYSQCTTYREHYACISLQKLPREYEHEHKRKEEGEEAATWDPREIKWKYQMSREYVREVRAVSIYNNFTLTLQS